MRMFGFGGGERYRGASATAGWLRIFGWLSLVGTLLAAFSVLASGADGSAAGFAAVLAGGGVGTAFLFAAGYGLDVLVDVANTLTRIDEKAEQQVRR